MPERTEAEGPWPSRTYESWRAWWQDPAANVWGPADTWLVGHLAFVHALMVETGRVTWAQEARLLTDSLGLSGKGKRDLRWYVKSADDGTEGEEEQPSTGIPEDELAKIRAERSGERKARLEKAGE